MKVFKTKRGNRNDSYYRKPFRVKYDALAILVSMFGDSDYQEVEYISI
jgi:hypothetical protein